MLKAAWLETVREVAIAALLLGAAELTAVVLLNFGTIANLWELQYGSLWLFPLAWMALGVGMLFAWGVARALLAPTFRARVLATLLLTAFVLLVAWGISSGRNFEPWWRRAGFVAFSGGLAAASVWMLGPRLAQLGRTRPGALAGLALCSALLLEIVNATVLVRLYAAFHWGLLGGTLLSVALASQALSRLRSAPMPRRTLWLWPLAMICCALFVLPASERLARFDNYRLLLLERAPILGRVVELGAILAPPPPLEEELPLEDAVSVSGSRVSFRGRSLLLITVDALRADHVRAYGYPRPTTPNIDRLAEEGARFEWAYCATPHTSYSITSLMTGKYIRPLLLQGLGEQSDTWATLLKTYEYRTAAFYPPAIFFIDADRFESFEQGAFGFEYQKKEFLEGPPRVAQFHAYLAEQPPSQRLFTWVHLFGPHEPYEHHTQYDFGPRDIDRYDSEIRAADETVGALVAAFRAREPDAVVMLTADHGEEFGEHGGRYHGTSVYEEQVRVPLLISAPGAVPPQVVEQPVQTIDLLPTVLSALQIPLGPRLRGRDLGPLLSPAAARAHEPQPAQRGEGRAQEGFAYAETDEQSMIARGSLRLVCQRKLGACRLFDVSNDPLQQRDVSLEHPAQFRSLRDQLRQLNATHGQYERRGLRAEGAGWPAPILRAIAGDGDAAVEVAELLDDADVEVRRKAAETLFRLNRSETAASLELALQRDEDWAVRAHAALALSRMGRGASLTAELLRHPELRWRRLAALALAENGDGSGERELIAWWSSKQRDYTESLELIRAFVTLRSSDAVWPLQQSLHEVRLRAQIAGALGRIGDPAARGPLALALADEPYQTARKALAEALLELGADSELVVPLRRWLGVADPLEGGLGIATQAGILEHVGGPSQRELDRLRQNANLGELVRVVVPKTGDGKGLRLLVRARNAGQEPAPVWVGVPHGPVKHDTKGKRATASKIPEIHPEHRLAVEFPKSSEWSERHALLPNVFGLEPGRASYLVVVAARGVEVDSLAVLPTQAERVPEGKRATESEAEQSRREAGNAGEQ